MYQSPVDGIRLDLLLKGNPMLRTCTVCGCETDADDGESRMRGHPSCPRCGLLFGDGHIAEETESGLCWYCTNEEDIPEEVNLATEDIELDKGE